jgi:hypothetical protein
MQVGDLVRFSASDLTGLIVRDYGNEYATGFLILVSGEVPFRNPTSMTRSTLVRTAEIISKV